MTRERSKPQSSDDEDKICVRPRASLDEKMDKDERDAFYDFYSDRALAIVLSAIVENRLTVIMRFVMRRNTKVADDLFMPTGPLGSFGTKIRLAFMLRLIDETMFKDLIVVSKIRNKFAHDLSIRSFDDQPVSDLIKSMHIYSIVKKMADDSDAMIKTGKPIDASDLIKRHSMLSAKDSYRQGLRFMIHRMIDFQHDLQDAENELNIKK